MKKTIKFISILILILVSLKSSAQLNFIESRGNYYRQYEFIPFEIRLFEPHFNFTFSGMALTIPKNDFFGGSYIVSDSDTFFLEENEESDLLDKRVSNLISFPDTIRQFLIYIDPKINKINFHLYNAGKPIIINLNTFRNWDSSGCSKPIMIDQSVWRAGLPSPTVKPTYTKTDHVVIHHTAGSNTSTDYLTEIRNIYLYHTQTNGWDDIGYNYVIARDGTIYEGRDGQDSIDNDFVKGAHFCAKNANTMGVSLMGDYSVDLPTPYAINSLVRLLTWKLYKDTLDPHGNIWHPRINPDTYLGVICGHRDACSTECPGIAFYILLSGIRDRVSDSISMCAPLLVKSQSNTDYLNVYPNPFSEELILESSINEKIEVQLFDIHGKLFFSKSILPESLILLNSQDFTRGLYILKTIRNNSCFYQKIQKY